MFQGSSTLSSDRYFSKKHWGKAFIILFQFHDWNLLRCWSHIESDYWGGILYFDSTFSFHFQSTPHFNNDKTSLNPPFSSTHPPTHPFQFQDKAKILKTKTFPRQDVDNDCVQRNGKRYNEGLKWSLNTWRETSWKFFMNPLSRILITIQRKKIWD